MSIHNLCFEQTDVKNIRVFHLKIFCFWNFLNKCVFVMGVFNSGVYFVVISSSLLVFVPKKGYVS